MLNKIKEARKELFSVIVFIIIFCLINMPLPYVINAPGGIINVSDIIKVDGINKKENINMTYVRVVKAIPITMLYATLNPNWDISSKKEENGTSTDKEAEFKGKIDLKASQDSAIITAFKYSNKKININDTKIYVTYIFSEAKTTLKVGDIINSIDGVSVKSREDVRRLIKSKNKGDIVTIKVTNNSKQLIRKAEIIEIENDKYIGISYDITHDIKTTPAVSFDFKGKEQGPSGGLMLALSIYSKINNIDIIKKRKISGTGTINEDGIVGEIGGIKYKLKGAVDNKMDIFLVPKNNYNEAIKEKKKNNYNIKIYSISKFNDAIEILKKTS